jgi:hypothetical protein
MNLNALKVVFFSGAVNAKVLVLDNSTYEYMGTIFTNEVPKNKFFVISFL